MLNRQLEYWRQKLAGAELLRLPYDRPWPAQPTYRAEAVAFRIPPDAAERLKRVGQSRGATAFMVVLAAFAALLHRYTGQSPVAIGSPITNRTHRGLEAVVGMFVNTLMLCIDLNGDPTFEQLLERTRETALGAFAHKEMPFDRIVEELRPQRTLGRNPLVRVALAYQQREQIEPDYDMADLKVTPFGSGDFSAKFDLEFHVWPSERGYSGACLFNCDLFDRTTIERLSSDYVRIVEAAVQNPSARLSDIPMLSEAAYRQITRSRNQARSGSVQGAVHRAFEVHASAQPCAPALLEERQGALHEVSYSELNLRANRLANKLRDCGVAHETLTGVFVGSRADAVLAYLAVLKAGGAFLPLDPNYPSERLKFMIEDSGATHLISQSDLVADLASVDMPMRVVLLDQETIGSHAGAAVNPVSDVDGRNAAYVIYTSGSTGRPKGVCVHHAGVANLASATKLDLEITSSSRLLQFSSLNFDASVYEIFSALANGACLCLSDGRGIALGDELASQLRLFGVTHVVLPPTVLGTIPEQVLADLKVVVSAGENCPVDLVRRWAPGRLFINAYGPTETTVCSNFARLSEDAPVAHIGRPMQNFRIYLLDAFMNPVPDGVVGEMYIGGAGIARGYLHRPDLTAERYLPDPFSDAPGERLFRTGDLARYLSDGNILYEGRLDAQIKIRGLRIEPGEIETRLRSFPAIRDCAVICRRDPVSDERLVAYYVVDRHRVEPAAEGVNPLQHQLRHYLAEALPNFMVPSAFVELETLPTTPHGKLDHRALPLPPASRSVVTLLVPPANRTEHLVASLWRELLGLETVGVDDNFFELGGHSLLLLKLKAGLENRLAHPVSIPQLFEYPTIRAFSRFLDHGAASVSDDARQRASRQNRGLSNQRSRASSARQIGSPKS